MQWGSVLIGAVGALAMRASVVPVLRLKFTRDVARLNAGDATPLLAAFAPDAVLRFAPGDHRWAGTWTGRAAIEQFLDLFTAAGIQGELREVAVSGPPWSMRLWARFDDHAAAPDGTPLYANRAVLVLRTRWGRIVEQDDFYADTTQMPAFDAALTAHGILAPPRP